MLPQLTDCVGVGRNKVVPRIFRPYADLHGDNFFVTIKGEAMSNNLAKTYDPKDFESRIYELWESSGAFRAKGDKSKTPFTIVMPPPNITGQLHMGHALDHTLQDVLIRWRRMQGYDTLWLPGSDHASIATEVKVAEKIRDEEGKTKEELGREEFIKRAWEWKRVYGGKITEQCRKLGDSCDWSKERFTMDEGCNRAVTEFFVSLFEKGLIYKGNRIINWCPCCGTTLSEAEVEHKDRMGKYYYIRYPGEDGGEGIVVATSRPETMFGDVAVAVHPLDKRYQSIIGKNVLLPLTGRVIPVIADNFPDPAKGTGAVKITPAHDPNDFEVGERHGLDQVSCIDKDGKMTGPALEYVGMDRYQCRKTWLSRLSDEGYLVKEEDITIPVGECYRCNESIEPMLSEQWFVRMEELAAPAIRVAHSGDLIHVPDRFEKIYLHWLEEIRDWCISRQLWWGHRIPAYYCRGCGEMIVAREVPASCPKCGSVSIEQDEDVLDTWFSSALWPFSTLGWPEKTEDLKHFYPTDVLVTGYDIIFFWVVRMVFSAMEAMEEPPFKYVYVHGLVRDAEGRKMSKSLGNGVDPLEVIKEYGADALRFMLTTGISPGNDLRFKMDRLESCRNFANKLWNASRFVIMNLTDGDFKTMEEDISNNLKTEDRWILLKTNDAIREVTDNMERFELALAGQKIYETIWNEFCDWYIELVKPRLYGDDLADKKVVRSVLVRTLSNMLCLLHPFMPFITEEIWASLPGKKKLLIRTEWPTPDSRDIFKKEAFNMELAMNIIRGIRNIRAETETAPLKKLRALIIAGDKQENVKHAENHIVNLGNLSEILYLADKKDVPDEVMSGVIDGVEIFVPLEDLIDYKAEYLRLSKEQERLKKTMEKLEVKLGKSGFIKKAPAKIVDGERDKLEKCRDMLKKLDARLQAVGTKLK